MMHPIFYFMGIPLWVAYTSILVGSGSLGNQGGSMGSLGANPLFSPLKTPVFPMNIQAMTTTSADVVHARHEPASEEPVGFDIIPEYIMEYLQ